MNPNVPQKDGQDARRPTSILFVLKQIEQATRAHLDTLLKPHGITAIQFASLSILGRYGELSSAELARHAFVRAQSMADMVTLLTRDGLITRRDDPKNRRRLLLSLTDKGSALLDEFRPQVAHLEAQMLARFSDDAIPEFNRMLHECRDALLAYPLAESKKIVAART